jgi:putative transposase
VGTHAPPLRGQKRTTRTRYRICDHAYPYFLTCTIVGWLAVFTRPDTVQIIFDSWTWLRTHLVFEIFGFVILENHLHLIASSPNLADDPGDFKSYTARRIIDYLELHSAKLLLKQPARHKSRQKTDRDYQLPRRAWERDRRPSSLTAGQGFGS